jgi:hypothetical protein
MEWKFCTGVFLLGKSPKAGPRGHTSQIVRAWFAVSLPKTKPLIIAGNLFVGVNR